MLKLGIGNYNEACRGIVMRYSKEWETTVNRMGRWIDFKNDYKTLNMRSVRAARFDACSLLSPSLTARL